MDNLAADFEINPNNPLNAEYELGEGVGFDCSFELYASGTVWGSIDGNINNQTDLINLFNTKVDLTDFEELSQTVTNNYNELSGDIADLTTTVTDNYNTLSGQISDLTGVVNNNYTSLDNRLTTAEGSILDLTDTVNDNYTELDGKITATNNNLSTLSQTVENNNTAINNRVDGIVESFDGDISDLNNAIDNLSDTVSDNYTDLNNKITDNTDDITTIQNTINSYGDIVSYNAAYFATANQGALADTAIQPNDNISELVNDVGYITSASLPTVNNATITIQKNGSNVGTFTLNQANNDTLNITVPTQASDIGAMPDTTTIEDLTTTAQLNALNSGATSVKINQIATNTSNIASINNTISGFGNIVTHNVSEFATSAQGLLANTALQPNDNISELTNDIGYITSADLPTNYVTTDTVQNISGRKTFLGEKAIYFKQNTTSDKLGFTLYNTSNAEVGGLEYRPNTINGNALLALNCPQSGSNYVGFRYWSGINIVAPRPTTNGNYFIPVNVTDGTNTVTANNNGTLNISTLLPDVSNFVTNSSLATTLADYQPLLVSGTNIKTINNNSILGSGNLTLDGLPSQTGQAGKFLTTNGSTASWANVDALPSQSGSNGKILTTNGSSASWSSLKTLNSTSLLGSGDITVQPTLVSGTNIKTINSTSLLGSGNIAVQPTLVSGTNIKTLNNTSLLGSGNISVQPTITSSAMLSSDLVDDTKHTHKFATAAQLTQIATNATNISTINGKIPAEATSSNKLAVKSDLNSFLPLRYSRYSIAQVNSTNKFIKLASMTFTQSGNRDFSYLFWVEILEASTAKCYALVRLSARWSNTSYQGHKFEILEKYGDVAASLKAFKTLTYAYSLNTKTHKMTVEIWLEIKNAGWVSYYLRPTECNEYGDYSNTPVTLSNNIWTYYNQSGNASSIASTAITSGLTQVKVTDATGVRNENDLSQVIKMWTGTKAQYDAIATKDANTLYNITDDNTADAYQAYNKSEVDALIQNALYYKSGDTFESSIHCVYPAFVTSSGTSVRIGITTPKRLDNITSVTCNSLIVSFRKSTGGYAPSGGWDAKANATSITCDIGTSNLIYVWVNYDNYGFTNNTPVGGETESFSFTFT